jgi:hypothetical protein
VRGDEAPRAYEPPAVDDYGDLAEITAVHMPLAQGDVSDLAFSASSQGPAGPAVPGAGPDGDVGGEDVSDPGGGDPGDSGGDPGGGVGGADASGGESSGSGGGGGELPFTGFAAAAAAAIGTGMTVAGGFLRKALRGRRN